MSRDQKPGRMRLVSTGPQAPRLRRASDPKPEGEGVAVPSDGIIQPGGRRGSAIAPPVEGQRLPPHLALLFLVGSFAGGALAALLMTQSL